VQQTRPELKRNLARPADAVAGRAKATEGTDYTDPCVERNIQGMKKNGIIPGAFHYGRPGSDPTAQANLFTSAAGRRRRWALAAAVVLCLLSGLSLTEATGVTKLRATVIRIFTPDGELVVETDDLDVKVRSKAMAG
jgi:hypothetical protein